LGTTAINLGQPKLMLDIWVAVVSCEIDRSINMQQSYGYGRWETIGLAATPEDMESLQSQMTTSEMNIAMMLTWNYMASKFNEQLDIVSELDETGKYIAKDN